MKTVILCGGLGTRLAEETTLKPKPMVEIGGMPILWHIMKMYAHYGMHDFILPLGYKGNSIKDYFIDYRIHSNHIKTNLRTGEVTYDAQAIENWQIEMVDTGDDTLTGGRLHRLEPYLKDEKTFMLTYGDGVSNIDIKKLLAFHKAHGKIATVTAVRPVACFGAMEFDGDMVTNFQEKPQTGEGWINGGFFVFQSDIFKYLKGDTTILERGPLEQLAKDRQLCAYKHEGFWQCMDTIRDRDFLRERFASKQAEWVYWD